ncbi:MAG: PH domain-containing protein [Bacilli bacterium]
MAYIKYKELTKYFNFKKEIDIESLPKYVTDYKLNDEIIIRAYKTRKDKGIFTDKRIILFDLKWFGTTKTIHTIPYRSISTIAVLYKGSKSSLLFSMDSGYQIRLNFVNMSAEDKMHLRKLYAETINKAML